jgi:asparagine synthetase B (glutamine-hydrolysing)
MDSSGGLSISDHFRNVVTAVDPSLRTTSDTSLIEHLLFHQLHGAGTYVSSVDRVTRGEIVEIDLATGAVSRSLVDKIEIPADRPGSETVIERLEAALQDASGVSEDMGKTCLLFSGGIDSTLLMTYLQPEADLVTFVPDSAEYAIETSYARDAARLSDADIIEVPVAEADFLTIFERSVRLIGIPTTHHVTPVFETVFDEPYDTVFVGEGADAMFGLSPRLTVIGGWFANPIGIPLLAAVDRIAPSRFRYRTGQLAEAARRLALPPGPRSFALGGPGGKNADLAIELFGRDAVLDVLETKLAFTRQRIDLEAAPDDYRTANAELRHWVYVLADPMIMERHQAQARGKRLIAPYMDPAVLDVALQIPPMERYIKGLSGKWLLKEILKTRLPEYPVDQRKQHTSLPFERYVKAGPLTDFWDRYEIPPEFTDTHRAAILAGRGLNWQAMTLAMWRAQIANDASLLPHPAKVTTETA